jgi:chemotaxis protein histidine kinase CheA
VSDSREWIPIFIAEASEHLEKLESGFSQGWLNLVEPAPLEELLRMAHTLKGSAQLMGFQDFAHLTHFLENILKEILVRLAPAKPDASARSRGSTLAPPNPHRLIQTSSQNAEMLQMKDL